MKKIIREHELRNMKLEQSADEVVISIKDGDKYTEVVKWISDEWLEDPSLSSTIFNTIDLYYRDPKKLLISLGFEILRSVEYEDLSTAIMNEVYHEVKDVIVEESLDCFIRLLMERENSRQIVLDFLNEDRKDAFMSLDTSESYTYLNNNNISIAYVKKFLDEYGFQPEDGEDTELIMDNHKYIVYNGEGWYIPESYIDGYINQCVSEFLIEHYLYM